MPRKHNEYVIDKKLSNLMNNQSQQQALVWFVTGASKGIGFELVSQLLEGGYQVAATTRDTGKLRQRLGAHAESNNFLLLAVDLTSETSIGEAIRATVRQFGRIDVVVNHAGFRQVGALEEVTDKEARINFDINVFGTLDVIRQVMPYLRKQQSGRILNFSSTGGISGTFLPGWGVYCATKFAIEGLSESLSAEVAPFGIKVTLVVPGAFRTGFHTSGTMKLAEKRVDDYVLVRQLENIVMQVTDNNPNDPARAATVLIRVATEPNPPLHLLLGRDAYDIINGKIKALQSDIENWKELSFSTGFN